MPVPLAKTTSRVLSLVDISYPGGRRWVGAARYRTKMVSDLRLLFRDQGISYDHISHINCFTISCARYH